MTIETDPSKVSPQTHCFFGTFRKPWSEINGNYCTVCGPIWTRERLRICYDKGHFDIPQYRLIEEPPRPAVMEKPECIRCQSSKSVTTAFLDDKEVYLCCKCNARWPRNSNDLSATDSIKR